MCKSCHVVNLAGVKVFILKGDYIAWVRKQQESATRSNEDDMLTSDELLLNLIGKEPAK